MSGAREVIATDGVQDVICPVACADPLCVDIIRGGD